jgi:hypothetical protein
MGGGGNNPADYNYRMIQIADSMDIVHGAHQVAFEADFIHGNAAYHNTQYSNGQFTFDGSQTGYGLADFLLGRVATFVQAPDGQRHDTNKYVGLFVQDTWKVSQHVTLNGGVRWDPSLPFYNQNVENSRPAQVLQFSDANFAAGKVSSVYPSAPAGLIFPGDDAYAYGENSFNSRHLTNFAPRVGIVFDPRGQGMETIRAGYGVFFDSPSMWNYNYFDTQAPWAPLIGLKSVQFSNPYATYPGGNPFPLTLSATSTFPTQANYLIDAPDTKPTYMQQWNVSVQKQFFSNLLVTASYMGNKTTHLWVGIDKNPAVYIPGNCAATQYGLTAAGPCSSTANTNQRRLLSLRNPAVGQYYAQINYDDQGGNASYNALVGSIQKRLSGHFSVLGNYTWSHCINDGEPTSGGAMLSGNPNYSNPFDSSFDRGNCSTDRRQILNLSGSLTGPHFSNALLGLIANDWQFAPMSGGPLTFTSGRDVALTGSSSGPRLNLVGDPKLAHPTTGAWFNTAAFASPATGAFGNVGRGVLAGPSWYVINLAMVRKLEIREKHHIELRAEAFNILNHVRLSSPNTSLSSALFGQITTAGDPRIMQFAIKYSY